MLFAQCGMFFLATGTDLVTLFIGLELMALCFYVMVGFLRTEKRSNEAAHEVSAAGRVFQRLPGLRILRAVRHRRLHQAGRHRRRRSQRARRWDPAGLPGAGHHLGRAAVQDFGRALPYVGAGRLRRRAHHRHRLSLGGFQGRLHRLPAAHLPGPAGIRARRLGADADRGRGRSP